MSLDRQNPKDTIAETFARSALPPRQRGPKKRLAPFSLRLSAEERALLTQKAEAAGLPLGAYIKSKALDRQEVSRRRTGRPVEDRQALAKALALLGRSDLAATLKKLAGAARIGALPVTPDVEASLQTAVEHVDQIRRHLIAGLGLKNEGRL